MQRKIAHEKNTAMFQTFSAKFNKLIHCKNRLIDLRLVPLVFSYRLLAGQPRVCLNALQIFVRVRCSA